MAIDLYHSEPSPPCRAVRIVAKKIGVEVNLIKVDLVAGAHKTAEFERMNPSKAVPVIVDDGFLLSESRVIITYLVDRYSPGHELYPLDAKKRAEIHRVLFLTAELFQRSKAIAKPVFYDNKWPIPDEPIQNYLELLTALEKLATGRKFLAGDEMSVADISFICDLTVLTDLLKVEICAVAPGIKNWMGRMKTVLPEYEELITKPVNEFKKLVESKLGVKLD